MKAIIRRIINWAYGFDVGLEIFNLQQAKENIGITIQDLFMRLDTKKNNKSLKKGQPMTELEKAAVEYANSIAQHEHNKIFSIYDFKAGANWQYEQFEKNRLAACDNMTEEEADREQEFVTDFLEKNLYAPTYSDAIEYGRKIAFEKAVEWIKLYILNHEYVDIFEMETAFKNELMEE